MFILWTCESSKCGYEEVAFNARYCAWCGHDMTPSCLICRQMIDPRKGYCTACSGTYLKEANSEKQESNVARR